MTEEPQKSLYRFEYYEPEDDETYVEWVWLLATEVADYRSSYSQTKIRLATQEEENLYNEAYADGYGVAAILEFESQYDGITFRVELDENGSLDMFNTTKMFQCAVCDRHLDFETEVATISNGMYVGVIKDDKLWHVCYDCSQTASEVEWLAQGWVIEDDPGSEGEKDR